MDMVTMIIINWMELSVFPVGIKLEKMVLCPVYSAPSNVQKVLYLVLFLICPWLSRLLRWSLFFCTTLDTGWSYF